MLDKCLMSKIKLFTDGSVNPQKKIGFGAYFLLFDKEYYTLDFKPNMNLKRFENTSSTKLELEVLLWALEDESLQNKDIIVYTDCQNILGLKNRRDKFEKNNYKTSTGKIVKNKELYKKFYDITDKLHCSFEKVKGHKSSNKKDEIDNLFNFVDKASRRALRNFIQNIDN